MGESRIKEEIVLKGEQITLLEKTHIFLSNFQIPVIQIRRTISATIYFFENLKSGTAVKLPVASHGASLA